MIQKFKDFMNENHYDDQTEDIHLNHRRMSEDPDDYPYSEPNIEDSVSDPMEVQEELEKLLMSASVSLVFTDSQDQSTKSITITEGNIHVLIDFLNNWEL